MLGFSYIANLFCLQENIMPVYGTVPSVTNTEVWDSSRSPEAWFNIKMSYQYRNLHCEYKTYLMTVLASQWKFLHKTAATNDWWDEDLYIESGPGIYISGHGIIQLKRPGLNSLAFGRFGRNFRWVIFKLILVIYGSCISCKIALR